MQTELLQSGIFPESEMHWGDPGESFPVAFKPIF